MTDKLKTADLAPLAEYEVYPHAAVPEEAESTPVANARRVMRGRYVYAGVLGVVLAGAGAFAGYTVTKPLYRSMAQIDVAPKLPRILYSIEENRPLPMYDIYVETQVALIHSARILDMALASPEWKSVLERYPDEDLSDIFGALRVVHPRRSRLIVAHVTHKNAQAATVATNAVVSAYMKIVAERDSESGLSTIKILENQRAKLNNQLKALRDDIFAATDGLGVVSIDSRYSFAVSQLTNLETVIADLDLEIAGLKSSLESGFVPPEVTIDEAASQDNLLAQFLAQRVGVEGNIDDLVNTQELGEGNPELIKARRLLDALDYRIAERLQAVREQLANSPDAREGKLLEAEARRAKFVAMRDRAQKEARLLGLKRHQLTSLLAEKATFQDRLTNVKRRLEQIDVESEVHGRISVLARAEIPGNPSTDRRLPLAAGGLLGGLVLGFVLVLVRGLLDVRMRHLEDVTSDALRGRFLGVFPEITTGDGATGHAGATELGDYCSHHIRTMLQFRAPQSSRVIALTSPSPGVGKTTLGLALGTSFGATRSRTLLVDCDFIGRGLTDAVRSLVCVAAQSALGDSDTDATGWTTPDGEQHHTRVASLLAARQGRITDADVRELLARVRENGGSLSEPAARSMRALEAFVAYRDAKSAGPHGRRGVLDALNGASIEDCVIETHIPNLSLLPAGDATGADAPSLSPAALERLVAKCRDRYDTVLIDTGPVLGSLEASFVAAAADLVLFVVSRGEQRTVTQSALGRLEEIGADVGGIVFNRASSADIDRSNYASNYTSRAEADA